MYIEDKYPKELDRKQMTLVRHVSKTKEMKLDDEEMKHVLRDTVSARNVVGVLYWVRGGLTTVDYSQLNM